MKITKVHIDKFRGFIDQEFEVGSQLTAIAGQNGTQKSTLLGIITQTFSIRKDNPMHGEKPLCGGNYRSAFSDKFRLSPTFDKPKGHEWTLFFDDRDPFQIESIKPDDRPNIRFWKKGSKEKGDGYIQLPTIFLSLKRLVPVAEETNIQTEESLLSEEEVNEFKELHNKILLVTTTRVESAIGIHSANKQSLGVNTVLYDWNQNSMGQDNIAKIILALFSFKRLKDKYIESYQGGILAIDELDATMYPASQVELLKVLRKYASDLKLQIFFTTHSLSLLKAVDKLCQEVKARPETSGQVKVLFLKRADEHIKINSDVTYESIYLDLNATATLPSKKRNKITAYVEDKETELFVKAILKQKNSSYLNFIDATFSCSTLIGLVDKNVPAFSYPFSIVFLDGDVRNNKNDMKKLSKAKNVLLLPGNESPERLIAKYLYTLSDESPLWSNIADGYTKQVCFREIHYDQIFAAGEQGRQKAKEWFNLQLQYWGRGGLKVLNPFLETMQEDVAAFRNDFEEMTKHYIHD